MAKRYSGRYRANEYRPRRWKGATVNPDWPDPGCVPWLVTEYDWDPQTDPDLDEAGDVFGVRCQYCGCWLSDWRAGDGEVPRRQRLQIGENLGGQVIVEGWGWQAASEALRQLAYSSEGRVAPPPNNVRGDGSAGGGFRSRGAILYAMRMLKAQDFCGFHDGQCVPVVEQLRSQGVEDYGRPPVPGSGNDPTPLHPLDLVTNTWGPGGMAGPGPRRVWHPLGRNRYALWDPWEQAFTDGEGQLYDCLTDCDVTGAADLTIESLTRRIADFEPEEEVPF